MDPMLGIFRNVSADCYSPGRFFAVHELKLMLAFTILRYDVKTKDGIRPSDFKLGFFILPDTKADILFKRRKS